MRGIGPGLRSEVVLGEHRHSGAFVALQHRNIDDVLSVLENRIEEVLGHGSIAWITVRPDVGPQSRAPVGVVDGRGRARYHRFPPQVGVTAVVEIMDTGKLPVPDII